jgi:hypothetical protein
LGSSISSTGTRREPRRADAGLAAAGSTSRRDERAERADAAPAAAAAPAPGRRDDLPAAAGPLAAERRGGGGVAVFGGAAGAAPAGDAVEVATSMADPHALHLTLAAVKDSGSLYLAPQLAQTIARSDIE